MSELKTTLARAKFKREDGPFFACLDKILSLMYIQRQAYHGGTFVGNHVHKLLKV